MQGGLHRGWRLAHCSSHWWGPEEGGREKRKHRVSVKKLNNEGVFEYDFA